MSRPIIAVDADDTIFDENNAVRLYMNERYGFEHTVEDYEVTGPYMNYFADIWQLSAAETTARYEAFEVAYKMNLKPLPRAIQVLRDLKANYDLVVLTSRNHRLVAYTHGSLAEHYPNIFKNVYFKPLWGGAKKVTKAEICLEIGASYLIDDCFEHCELAAEAGVEALLFGEYGWNRIQELPPHMTRVKNWAVVKEYFDGR